MRTTLVHDGRRNRLRFLEESLNLAAKRVAHDVGTLGVPQQSDLGARAARGVVRQGDLESGDAVVDGGEIVQDVGLAQVGRVVERLDLGSRDGLDDAARDAADAPRAGGLVAAAGHDDVQTGRAGTRRVLGGGAGGEEAGQGGRRGSHLGSGHGLSDRLDEGGLATIDLRITRVGDRGNETPEGSQWQDPREHERYLSSERTTPRLTEAAEEPPSPPLVRPSNEVLAWWSKQSGPAG